MKFLISIISAMAALMIPSISAFATGMPTLYIIGDSTVKNHTKGLQGWGDRIQADFDTSRISIVNSALGGRSSRTYFTEELWEKVRTALKPGDYVLMQFGHNDGGSIRTSYRASLKGVGDETAYYTDPKSGKVETVHTYGWYLRKYIDDTKSAGAQPIVLSPVPRNIWDANGKVFRNGHDYGGWSKDVAAAAGVPFVDLNAIVADKYDLLGPDQVKAKFFPGDHTHTSPDGAALNADSVAAGLRAQPQLALTSYLLKGDPRASIDEVSGDIAVIPSVAAAAHTKPSAMAFTFGTDAQLGAAVRINALTPYTSAGGFGFEPGTTGHFSRTGFVSDDPFTFSMAVPEGTYLVTVKLGNDETSSITTVKAELRRLMAESVSTKAHGVQTRLFSVSVRKPQITGGGNVVLKSRELTAEWQDWDDRLTLQFSGTSPSVSSIAILPALSKTVYLLGDSTVCDQPGEPYCSWGQMLPRFLGPSITVSNYAESGETVRSSIASHRLDKVLSLLHPNDLVLIQFGHNDQKEKGAGMGPYQNYTDELTNCVASIRAKGGLPVLVTPVSRQSFDRNGDVTNSLGDYPEAVRRLATRDKVPLIDLNAMSQMLYEAIGQKDIKLAFAPGDRTHHNDYGAYEIAKCVLRGLHSDNLLRSSDFAPDVLPFDPSHPDKVVDFGLPFDPAVGASKPLGN